MFTSLRSRLLVSYSVLLAVVITAFAALVLLAAWRARIAVIDAGLERRGQALAAGVNPSGSGTFDLTLPADSRPSDMREQTGEYHAVWDTAGHVIDQFGPPGLEPLTPSTAGMATTARGREYTLRANAGAVVLVGQQLDDVRRELWQLAVTMGAIGFGSLLVVMGGGWWLVGRALSPIRLISQTAQAMVDGDFTARIRLEGVETEVEQLARALNEAFDRLYDSLQRQQQFAADASHELRTPLATLTTEAHWARAHDRTPDEYRASLDVCRRAAARMQQTVEQLLELARTDAGDAAGVREPCRLDTMAAQIVDALQPMAATRRVRMSVEAAPMTVSGDPDRLREALTNLVANAIHYNVDDGRVWVTVDADADRAVVAVRDNGIGIATEHQARIFDRFYRVDAARSSGAGGAGLGLAVARAIAEQHGGTLSCVSAPGEGSTFTLTLPA